MKKTFGFNLLALCFVFPAFATPQYTLQDICTKYGTFNQCSSVPFCRSYEFPVGCYLAQGAPSYVEGLCKIQTEEQGCKIMAAQGNCVWVAEPTSICKATANSL